MPGQNRERTNQRKGNWDMRNPNGEFNVKVPPAKKYKKQEGNYIIERRNRKFEKGIDWAALRDGSPCEWEAWKEKFRRKTLDLAQEQFRALVHNSKYLDGWYDWQLLHQEEDGAKTLITNREMWLIDHPGHRNDNHRTVPKKDDNDKLDLPPPQQEEPEKP